jgi:hypothetical protein
MHLYYGSDVVDSVADLTFPNTVNPANIGDVNGDGKDDFTMRLGVYGTYVRAVYFGGSSIDTIPDLVFGYPQYYPSRSVVRGDFNNDETDEIVSQGSDGWSICFYDLQAAADSLPNLRMTPANILYDGYAFGECIVTGDFNGDNFPDLACNLRRKPADTSNGQVYIYWGGPDFDTIPDVVISRGGDWLPERQYFGDVMVSPGDFNGDGFDDLYVSSHATEDTSAFLYWGGPDIDSFPDLTILGYRDRAALAGDIDNDGYPDIITSMPTQWSGIGWVYLYYGGPDVDSLPDFELYINDLPGYKTQFGMDVAGIGDFNGDGIDDFAFSCVHAGSIGTVYIYAGFDGSTSTGGSGGGGVVLPVDFELFQNYPNPFNPTTTIAFQLPLKSHVEIDVFNVLGQLVATLVSAEYPAGSHSVVWDGTDAAGDEVASGVYMYRLTAGDVVFSRKMVLAR